MQARAAERRAQALELRVAGASLSQIAERLNYSKAKDGSIRTGPVATDIKRAIRAVVVPGVEELRELENRRLDELQRAHWLRATGNGEDAAESARIVLKCIEVRCKINGINTPAKVDLSAWLRDFAEREGLPYDFAVSAANDIIRNAGF